MRLYLRSRRSGVTVVCVIGAGVVVGVLGDRAVPVPNLAGGPGYGTLLGLLAPAPVVALLARGLGGRALAGERAAVRHMGLRDAVWVIGAVSSFAVAAEVFDQHAITGAATRNLLGFTGLMLLADRYSPDGLAAAASTAYALIGATLGQARDPTWWVWFLRPDNDPVALGIAALSASLGLAALLSPPLPAYRSR